MRRFLAIGLLFSISGFVGCMESLPAPPPPSKTASKIGPHQGTAFAIPDDLGYAEIVNEPPIEARGNKIPTTSIVVYFLGSDAKSPATSTPTDVKFTMNDAKNSGKAVVLKAEPKAEDPAGSSRFISEPGPYRVEDLRGELSATIGGKPIKIPVVEGR